jgi:hypothetical protein
MACEIVSTEEAVFVLWGKPTRADADRAFNRVELIASAASKPILYITRVPANAPAPDPDVRAHINAMMPQVVKACSSYHVILEGTGFISAIKRGVLASLLQFGWRKGTFFVHDTDKGVIPKLDRAMRPAAEKILRLARERGLLTAPAPEDLAPSASSAGLRRSA